MRTVSILSALALMLSCGADDPDAEDVSNAAEAGEPGAMPSGGRMQTGGAGGAGGAGGEAGSVAGSGGSAGQAARGDAGAGGAGPGKSVSGGSGFGGRVTYESECGNSIREGIEQCDGSDVPGKNTCSATCTFQECDVCLAGICGGLINHFECRRFGGEEDEAGRAQCAEMLDCMHATGCAAENGNASRCFCGNAFDAEAGGAGDDFEIECSGVLDDREANGACREVIERALGTQNRRDITTQLRNPTNPVGYAMLGIACETDLCASACSAKVSPTAMGGSNSGAGGGLTGGGGAPASSGGVVGSGGRLAGTAGSRGAGIGGQ